MAWYWPNKPEYSVSSIINYNHCDSWCPLWCLTGSWILVPNVSGNGLMPGGTKPSPEPMVTASRRSSGTLLIFEWIHIRISTWNTIQNVSLKKIIEFRAAFKELKTWMMYPRQERPLHWLSVAEISTQFTQRRAYFLCTNTLLYVMYAQKPLS